MSAETPLVQDTQDPEPKPEPNDCEKQDVAEKEEPKRCHDRWKMVIHEFFGSAHRVNALCLLLWALVGWYATTNMRWGAARKQFTTIESVYWMAQIITTVGYGDMPKPLSRSGELFVVLYVLAAAFVIGTFIGSLMSQAFDKTDDVTQTLIESSGLLDENNRLVRALTLHDNNPTPPKQPSRKKGGISVELKDFLWALFKWCLCVLAWGIFFVHWEGKSRRDAVYMAVITLTTVGFGDVVPSTPGGKLFAALGMLVGVGAFANSLAKFSTWLLHTIALEELDESTLSQIVTNQRQGTFIAERAKWLETNPSGKLLHESISRSEFMLYMLTDMGVVDDTMVDRLSETFDTLDTSKNGFLEFSDLSDKVFHKRKTSTKRG